MAETEWGERKTGASKAEVESGKWIAVQKRIFTRWANAYLKARKLKIGELTTDLQDGVILINLLEILSGEAMPRKWRKNPSMEIHKRENLKLAFEFMASHNLRLTNIGSVDVWDGNEKIILGLMWTIIAKFQVGEISVEGVSGKDALKLWCRHKTAGYDGVEIKNFHRSWKDGLAFCALIHKHRPEILDFDALSADGAAENLALAFQLAEDYFGIDRILDVEDIVDAPKPDEKIVITYVAFIFKGLAEFLRRKALAKSIGKAITITKTHDGWIAETTEKGTALREELVSNKESFEGAEVGNTAEALKALIDAFNEYQSGTKPDLKQRRVELKGVFSALFASARNNDRPLYVAPEGLSPADMDAAWAAMETAEAAYEQLIRAQYRVFVQVETNIAKLNAKAGKLNEWLAAQSEVFSSGEYGDTLMATETLITAYEAFEGQLEQQRQTVAWLREWAATEGIEGHAEHESTLATVAAVEESLASVVETGAQYREYLGQMHESHDKLGQLDEVAVWIASKNEFFGEGRYGDTLGETNALLEAFGSWAVEVAPHEEVLAGLTSEQEHIVERLEAERESLAALKESADTYNTYLLCTQEYFEKTAALEKLAGWVNGQRAKFEAEDYGADLASTKALLALHNETFSVVLPREVEALEAMETYQEELQAEIDSSKASLQELQQLGETYENALLLAQERFEKLPVLSRIEAWVAAQNAVFEAADYGSGLEQVRTLLTSCDSHDATAAQHGEALGAMESNQDVITAPLEALRGSLAAMGEAAAEYRRQLVLHEERLLRLPLLEGVLSWAAERQELFDAADYGADLPAVASLLEAHQSFPAQVEGQKAVVAEVETEQEVVAAQVAAATAALEAVEEAGDGYHTQLLLSQERFEKLPLLENLDTWIGQQAEVFAGEDYGETLGEVDALLSAFNTYSVNVATKKEVLAAQETYQQVILDALEGTRSNMAALDESAEYYNTQLLLSQERLEKLPALERIDAWLERQGALFAAQDYGENMQDAELLLSAYNFIRNSFPANKEVLDGMESYQGVINEALAAARAKMEATEAAAAEYERQLQLSVERHEKLPRLARVTAWIGRQTELFDAAHYGDSLAEVDLLERSFKETYTATRGVQEETVGEIESEQEAIVAVISKCKSGLADVAERAAAYANELVLARERFEKLPVLDRLEGWLEAHGDVFARADYGEGSLAAVNVHLANFEESFTLHLDNKKAVLAGVESAQAVITERVSEVSDMLSATESAAAEYHAALLLSKERHLKMPQLDHVDRWLDVQAEVFTSGDFGDSAAATEDKLASFDAYRGLLELQRQVLEGTTSEQEVVATRRQNVLDKMTRVDEAAEGYHTELLLSQERLQKLPIIAMVKEWLDTQMAVFSSEEYGSTMVEVANKLSEHEAFDANVVPQKEVLANIETYQEAVATPLAEAQALAASVEEAGGTYKLYLQLRQEQLEKWPMLDRVSAFITRHQELFAAAEYGDSLRAVAVKLSEFEMFPSALAAQSDIVDNMESYQEDIVAKLEELKAALAALKDSGDAYNTQLLCCQERLEKLPALERGQAWMTDASARFAAATSYGDSLVEVSGLLSRHATFTAASVSKREFLDTMESYQEEVLTPLAAAKAQHDALQGEAAAHEAQLLLCQERLQKLPKLDEVDAWLATRAAVFDAGNTGETLAEVATLLSSHAEAFSANLPAKAEVLASMETEQEVIAERLAASAARLSEVKGAAAAYEAALLDSQERLEKLPALDAIEEWCAASNALFAGGEHGSTLVEVATLLSSYESLSITMVAKTDALAGMASTQDVVAARVEELKGTMAETEAAAEQYQLQLLLSQERLQKLPSLERTRAWLDAQAAAFLSDDFGATVREVRQRRELVRNFERGLAPHQQAVAATESDQAVILEAVEAVAARIGEVQAAAQTFSSNLDQQEAALTEVARQNKEYNAKADTFLFDVADVADELNTPIPVLLDALEELWTKFTGEVQPRLETITAGYTELEALANGLTEAGAEAAFSRFTLNDLYERYSEVYNAMSTREEALGAQLTEERERDALRVEFAGKATELREYADGMTVKVGGLAGSLQEQLDALQALQAEYQANALLNEVYECATRLEEAGVVDNPHTTESYHSLYAVWEGLERVLAQQEASLQGQILATRDEHITPEQYTEIKDVFTHFDLDGDAQLNVTEFSYCCTSIGLVLSKEEITAKITELDSTGDGCVNFEEFTSFMMERLVEPGHNKSDVAEAFVALADKETYVTKRLLVTSFTDTDALEYVLSNLPRVDIDNEEDECMEYAAFVEDLFSR